MITGDTYPWILTPSSTNTVSCTGNIETLRGATGNDPSSTTMGSMCYLFMFLDCTCLTSAPSLPATVLSERCYQSMFNGCTSLTQAPALPAQVMATGCYQEMFSGCTSLLEPADISHVTKFEDWCFMYMYSECSNMVIEENKQGSQEHKAWTVPDKAEVSEWNKDMFSKTGSSITKPEKGKTYYVYVLAPAPNPTGDEMTYDTTKNSFVCEFYKGQATTATAHINGATKLKNPVVVKDETKTLEEGTDKDYVVNDGSIKVTFNTSYLNSLSVGTHTININVRANNLKVTITVKDNTPTPTPTPPYVPVDTSTK